MKEEAEPSANAIARLAGALYLVLMPVGFFGIAYVPMRLVVPDDPAATAANITASELLLRSWERSRSPSGS